jgi:nucleoside-diphosphate-sugar epimerase
MNRATVLGSRGFIGTRLCEKLLLRGYDVFAPSRGAKLEAHELGTVFYCIGLTADFRRRVFETVIAHVEILRGVLQYCRFERLVYLSSTRLYSGASNGAREDDSIRVNPSDNSDVYNLSKAMGESLALHSGRSVRIARLSNVYGADWASENFLPLLIKAALRDRRIVLQTSRQSCKDYIDVDDVVDMLIRIGEESRDEIYNIASGCNTTNGEIVDRLSSLTGCAVEVVPDVPAVVFPEIDIRRLQSEFDFEPASLSSQLPGLLDLYRRHSFEWK